MNEPLLVELFTEELPPKALARLGEAFAAALADGLRAQGLAPARGACESFATPRRLAVRIADVRAVAEDRAVELKGPSVAVGLDASGEPTLALRKWADKQGASVERLVRASDGRQECFFFRSTAPGATLEQAIGPLIEQAVAKLPIPKVMQYQLADGRTNVSFVRPAHGLVVMHGARVVPASVLGLRSGDLLHGHRFQGEPTFALPHAREYEALLASRGRVIASFEARRARIDAALRERAAALGVSLGDETQVAPLLDEVTALVEWPAVYVGAFEPEFLAVPQECLILTMRTNQKYFPLFDASGRLDARFLIVSNMEVDDPSLIVDGNQRVVRPRLADARFFFEQDKKQRLADRVPQLGSVVYHAKLGTQAQRTERVRALARAIAPALGVDAGAADRAALLSKADLPTGMVGEFPELQGTMGRHYALHDGEPPEVAQAIAEHYQPRFAGDALPASGVGTAVALADKLETLAGIWGVGQQPTGDRDPFALRRHALGVVRMLVEHGAGRGGRPLALRALLDEAFAGFASVSAVVPAVDALHAFVVDRLRGWLRERGHPGADVDAVLAVGADRLDLVPPRLEAIAAFRALPEAASLAAANKRIGNILRKADGAAVAAAPDAALLVEDAERALHAAVEEAAPPAERRLAALDYAGALAGLAALRGPVDAFFDGVMVNADDPALRANRLALLGRLHRLMNRVADLSKLAT
ncbi:MAG TPA: glycine--tRNA ligase subunit beta [Burkholderiaceae bacterium]|nr:glycine--tRNA ligase subunit beta [Burkholderiaceae bacterium]